MGTSNAILDYRPRFSPIFGQTVFYVPAGVAALSEPAFCALQCDKIVNDGIIGFHMLFNPETQQALLQRRLATWKLLLKYNVQPKSYIKISDLNQTTASVFFLRSRDKRWDRQLVDWHILKNEGFTIVGNVRALEAEIEERGQPIVGGPTHLEGPL